MPLRPLKCDLCYGVAVHALCRHFLLSLLGPPMAGLSLQGAHRLQFALWKPEHPRQQDGVFFLFPPASAACFDFLLLLFVFFPLLELSGFVSLSYVESKALLNAVSLMLSDA